MNISVPFDAIVGPAENNPGFVLPVVKNVEVQAAVRQNAFLELCVLCAKCQFVRPEESCFVHPYPMIFVFMG